MSRNSGWTNSFQGPYPEFQSVDPEFQGLNLEFLNENPNFFKKTLIWSLQTICAYYKTSKKTKVTVITQFNNRLISGSSMSVVDAISEATINKTNRTAGMIKLVCTTIFICIDSIDIFHLMNYVE